MGSTIWIEVYNRLLKATADDCCKLLSIDKQLDHIAERLGVPRLSKFFDWTEMSRLAEQELKFLEARERGEEEPQSTFIDVTAQPLSQRQATGEWFDSAEGLNTLLALRKHLDEVKLPTNPGDQGRYCAELLDEFAKCEEILRKAASDGQRFRFLIVP